MVAQIKAKQSNTPVKGRNLDMIEQEDALSKEQPAPTRSKWNVARKPSDPVEEPMKPQSFLDDTVHDS